MNYENIKYELERHYINIKNNIIFYLSEKLITEIYFYDKKLYPKQWIVKCEKNEKGHLKILKFRKGCEKHEEYLRNKIKEYNENLDIQSLIRQNRFIWGVVSFLFLITMIVIF